MRRRRAAALLAFALMPAHAAQDPELEALRDRLAQSLPEVRREDIRRSAAPGLFEVRAGRRFGYVTADGRYLVSGDLSDLQTGEDLTAPRRREARLQAVSAFAPGAVEFAPVQTKQWITVFTDVDCPYCRQFHREVPALNAAGVGLRYLFFSKDGAPSAAFEKAQRVWCNADPKAALDTALSGATPKGKADCKNPVLEQYLAAKDLGFHATPMIVLPDGGVIEGYVSAKTLLEALSRGAPDKAEP